MIPWFHLASIDIGFLKIHIWGLFVSLGFIAGITFAYFELKRKKMEAGRVFDLAFWIILCAIIGGRLVNIAEHLSSYVAAPLDILKIWQGGMSVYGGFLGAILAAVVYLKKNKLDFWQYGDAVMFGLPLGYFIGRLGCFFLHEHPGTETKFFLGVLFPDGVARHDLGLYLSLTGLAIFLIFLIFRRSIWWPGFYVSMAMILYGAVRFFLDFLRTREVVLGMPPDPRYFGLTLAQYLSIVLFVAGIYLFYKLKRGDKVHSKSII